MHLQRAQVGRKSQLGWFHERAVERGADGKRHDAFRAQRFGSLAGAANRLARPGDHYLIAAVHVGRADHFALGGLGACLLDLVGVETQNGGHRANTQRHRFLHVTTAAAHRSQRVRKRKGPGCDIRGILAEAVTGNVGRRQPPRREQTTGRRADGEDRGLRVLGDHQLPFRSVEDQMAESGTKRRVGFGERLPTNGKGLCQRLPHANVLCALSGKDEGDQYSRLAGLHPRSRSLGVPALPGCPPASRLGWRC